MPAPLSPQTFVAKWRSVTLKERSAVQEHFLDLCHLLGHDTPAGADRTGESFTFEAGADKVGGGHGFADVWKKGYFAWEYKGKHANLDKAYQQLLQYREALLNPPLLVVSDIDQIVIHTNFTNTQKKTYTLALDDLLRPDGMATLRAVFYSPESLKAPLTPEQVTREAATEFALLAEQLRMLGHHPHQVAHFLIRLLFCLFAEDVDLLPKRLFSRLVQQGRTRPDVFTQQVRDLFRQMSKGGWFGADEIAWFNGRLFDDDLALDLDAGALDILNRVSGLDWSSIEPSILGTLFERSLDPSKRAQLGAHYTSRDDILLIVEPVLMAPYRRRWQAVKQQAQSLAAARESANRSQRARLQKDLSTILTDFARELAGVQVLDPACGSGNFLYVSLQLLHDLEKEVMTLARELDVGSFFPSVSPEQLHGIELNPYAHELAQATVWIGHIQWLRDNGFGAPTPPILKPLENIKEMDAILDLSSGEPHEPEWPAADVIVGNPPFLGGKRLRAELGDNYVDPLFKLYEGRVPHEADLVGYWFDKARTLIAEGKVKRAGLLATQAIRAGANRKVLLRIKETGDIFYAQSDRPWVLEGAAVRVSMIGFDNGSEQTRLLNEIKDDSADVALQHAQAVSKINADLTAQINLADAHILPENQGISFMGVTPVGAFDVSEQQAQKWLALPVNPGSRSNIEVLRPYLNAHDVTSRPRRVWIIDFGTHMPLEEAAYYEAPFEYVKLNVKPQREQNNRATYRDRWWIFAESRPAMRQAVGGLRRYIVTPRVAKHRLFVWVDAKSLVDSRLYIFARDDDYFFGVLHSSVHEPWSLANASTHGDGGKGGRPTYNNTTCFETFPFPWPPGKEPKSDPRVEAIAQAARDLVARRDAWLDPPGASEQELKKRTLTNLYNQRPEWLVLAHRALDHAVLDAYGWPHDLADEEILSRLLALNLARSRARSSTRN